MADARFRPEDRLKRGDDFRRTFDVKQSVADDLLVVYGAASESGRTRLGLSVSRKVGNAVTRNRWKRLLREAFRLTREELPAGLDLIVIPRKSATPELAQLMKSLPALARRLAKKLERPKKSREA